MANEVQLSVEFGVNALQDIISAGYDFLKKESKRRDLSGNATTKYVQGMIDRYSEVKVLGMSQPVPLLNLYVRANILEKIPSRIGGNVKDLEKKLDFFRREFDKSIETIDGEEIANQEQRFIVLGKPGAGKTTFLRYMALAMLSKQSIIKQRRLPILVTLRLWADQEHSLIDYMVEQFNICGFEKANLFVEHMLGQGNCLVLFDGLDEVSQETNLDKIIQQINDFTDKYSKNQFIISCRIAAYNNWFERFTDVEMADFGEEQIETFIKNWFATEPETYKACLERINGSIQLRELAVVPLLLSLLCITYDADNDFPANRAELYERAINVLLRTWDSSRRIQRENPYKKLSIKKKENMFAQIAFDTFSNDRYFIRERELLKMIEGFISNLSDFKKENLEVDSVKVLTTIEASHGIFVERARTIHSFGHLTFQEYFSAKYIVDNASDGTLKKLVEGHLHDDKWKEVFVLVAGMLPNATHFILHMFNKNRLLIADKWTKNFLEKLTKVLLQGENSYGKGPRKSIALYFILAHGLAHALALAPVPAPALARALAPARAINRAINLALAHALALARGLDLDRALARGLTLALTHTRDRDIARDLDLDFDLDLALSFLARPGTTLARDRARALARARTFPLDLDLDLDLARDLARDLAHDLAHAREDLKNETLEKSLLNFSDFLKGNILIIECLNADCYISNTAREYILDNILEPLQEEEKK